MSNQEISLKWNGYQNNILSNVKELYKDEGLSDVTLVCDGHSFKAHKVILSANSSVFRTIFQQNPRKDPIIVLHDINTASLRTLLTFMYNGEVNVTEEFLPVLLKTAEALRICGLSTGSDASTNDNEKTATTQPKKRKKSENQEDNNNKVKKPNSNIPPTKPDVPCNIKENADSDKMSNIVPKEEPIDSPSTDYSGENTNDADIALLDDNMGKKYPISPDILSGKPTNIGSGDRSMKKWVSEVSSTQPCLNNCDKNDITDPDDDKDSIEIDKEVETVLQSASIVETLSITMENLNSVSTEAQNCKDKTACYANPLFPCPFCPRVYNSWGYRRRHVKSRHMTNRYGKGYMEFLSVIESGMRKSGRRIAKLKWQWAGHTDRWPMRQKVLEWQPQTLLFRVPYLKRLSCKWCVSVLPSTGAWYSHATRTHGISHEEARNSLVVMVEAHAVLTLNEPSVAQLLGQVGMNDGCAEKSNNN